MGKNYVAERENALGGSLIYGGNQFLRGMMLQVSSVGLSEDLKWNAPEYMVEGVKNTKLARKEFLVKELFKMEELLKLMKLDTGLTQRDVNNAFHTLFENDHWLNSHMGPLGFKKEGNLWVPSGNGIISPEVAVPYRDLVLQKQFKAHRLEPGSKDIKAR